MIKYILIILLVSNSARANYHVGVKLLTVPVGQFDTKDQTDGLNISMSAQTNYSLGTILYFDFDFFELGSKVLSIGIGPEIIQINFESAQSEVVFDLPVRFKVSMPVSVLRVYWVFSPGYLMVSDKPGFSLSSAVGAIWNPIDTLGLFVELGYKFGIFKPHTFNMREGIGIDEFNGFSLGMLNVGVQYDF